MNHTRVTVTSRIYVYSLVEELFERDAEFVMMPRWAESSVSDVRQKDDRDLQRTLKNVV